MSKFEEFSLVKPLNLDKKTILKRQSTIINQAINLEIVGKGEEK